MALDQKKYELPGHFKDLRPLYVRFGEWLAKPRHAFIVCMMMGMSLIFYPPFMAFADILLILTGLFFWWLYKRNRSLPFKLPMDSKFMDGTNTGPGRDGKPTGILYLGNAKNSGEEIWFNNSDARTHILYLGTTGAGKTEGLKSMVTNALTWGSGFVYIDGKADTDLWSSLSSLVRRFGRDDDLLVLNYMTGNSDARAPSNTMNPFSSGSASYLTNMLVSLMPQAEGDNAMWKERAVSLISSLMPALTWKRDHQDVPLSVSTIRNFLELSSIIKLSRDDALPPKLRESIKGYLDTLPGYIDDAFDDTGKEKSMGPGQPMVDTTTVRQQHGYLTMQFTRSLQSLGDDYGYIFDADAADVDMVDVVLNRRILIVLIPALEKSGDEIANLGKIVAATIKGMMGSTLGSTVEGEGATVIENKPTHSATPFITVFDEVGYYVAEGMAVMAAQARSLGFSLVFSAQDLPALQKRVKEEARSITGNCNIKIFGKLSDPTDTKDFFERQAGKALIAQSSSFQLQGGMSTGSYMDTQSASIHAYDRADYGDLKKLREGMAVLIFEGTVIDVQIFYCNPGFAKAMRVTRYLSLPPPDEHLIKHAGQVTKLRDLMFHKTWTADKADVAADISPTLRSLIDGLATGKRLMDNPVDHGIATLGALHAKTYPNEVNETAPPVTTSSAPVTPSVAIVPQNPAPVSGGNPMGFFGKTTPATAPEPTAPARESVSWDQLVTKDEPQSAVSDLAASTLSPPIQKILQKSGDDLRKKLLKNTESDDA